MAEDNKTVVSKCEFMKIPKCYKQIAGRPLNLQICQCCMLGRIERHLFSLAAKMGTIDGDKS